MFDLKKYKITKAFGTYKAGQLVAFNGADAEKYKAYIAVYGAKAVEAPVVEVKEEKKTKRVRKGKK